MLTDEINDAYMRGYKDGKDYEASMMAHIAQLEAALRDMLGRFISLTPADVLLENKYETLLTARAKKGEPGC